MASTILSLSGASSQPGPRGVEEVLIRLSTPFAAYRVPNAALSVPADLNRNGLSAVVHHLMGIDAGSSAAGALAWAWFGLSARRRREVFAHSS